MHFKIGDKVRMKGNGIEETIVDIDKNGNIRGQYEIGITSQMYLNPKYYELIERSEPMKYQDLKVRIEALTGNSTLKEVDDIAQEVRNLSKKGGLSLEISLASDNAGFIRISHCKNEVAQFNSNFQCEKLVALKDALMWLLDHSELAKEKLVGREIEADYNGTKIVAKVLRVVG